MKPSKIVQKLLLNATNLDVVQELVSEDATYVSLNYDNADLQAVRSTFNIAIDDPNQKECLTEYPADRTVVRNPSQRRAKSDLSDLRRCQHVLGGDGFRHICCFRRHRIHQD